MAKNKKTEKPVEGSDFTAREIAYINEAAKQFPWPIQVMHGAYIHVPFNEVEDAENHMIVNHLRSKFGFIVQGCITPIEKRDVFNPEMKKRREIERPTDEKIVDTGEIYLVDKTGERLEVVELLEHTALVKAVGQMSKPTAYSYAIIREMIYREAWVKC